MATSTAQVRSATTAILQPIGSSDALAVGVGIDRLTSGILSLAGANTTQVTVPDGSSAAPGIRFSTPGNEAGLFYFRDVDGADVPEIRMTLDRTATGNAFEHRWLPGQYICGVQDISGFASGMIACDTLYAYTQIHVGDGPGSGGGITWGTDTICYVDGTNATAGNGVAFNNDADTSFTRTAADTVGIFVGGTNRLQVTNTGSPGVGVTGVLAATGAVTGSNLSGTHSGTSSGTNTGDITVGAIGASANANGMTLTAQALVLQPASAAFGGVLTSGTQSIAGDKTFTGAIAASNLSGTHSGTSSGTNTGDVTIGTANGLSVVGQALSMAAAGAATTGAITSGAQTIGGQKTFGSAILAETTGTAGGGYSFTGDTTTSITRTGASALGLFTGGTQAIAIDSSQRVGIGTTTPATLQGSVALSGKVMQVQATANHAQLILSAGGSGKVPVLNLENTDATSGKRLFQQYYNGANNYLQMTFASESAGTVITGVGLFMDNSGKVGLGRASGSAFLDIGSDGSVSAPALTLGATADTNTGIWHPAAEQLAVAVNGTASIWASYNVTNAITKVNINNAAASSDSDAVFKVVKSIATGIPAIQASSGNGGNETNIDCRSGSTTTTDYATISVTNPGGTSTPQLVMYAFPSAIGGTYFGASSRNSGTALLHLNATGLMFIGSVSAADVYFGRQNLETLRFTSTEVVVNDASRDVDFRVETDTNANAFIVDAGADTITCGSAFTASAAATFSSTVAVNGAMTFGNAINMVFNTSTGTKIGTGTTQKIGFYNATPVAQGAGVADATGGTIIDIEARAALNALISRIEALGLIATV